MISVEAGNLSFSLFPARLCGAGKRKVRIPAIPFSINLTIRTQRQKTNH